MSLALLRDLIADLNPTTPGWHSHDGYLAPEWLNRNDLVRVVYQNGGTYEGPAHTFRWAHNYAGRHVVAFRLL
jgi:hypothetical protein